MTQISFESRAIEIDQWLEIEADCVVAFVP